MSADQPLRIGFGATCAYACMLVKHLVNTYGTLSKCTELIWCWLRGMWGVDLESEERKERVELWKANWRELECKVDDMFRLLENIIEDDTLPASVIAKLRESAQDLSAEWDRECQVHQCDVAHIFTMASA